jgi:transposase
MSWQGVTVMDQRIRFIGEYLKGYFLFNELCFQFSVSRKTGYKWVQRYEEQGLDGLNNRSTRPHNCPNGTDAAIIEAIVAARLKHPSWGPKKLLQIISSRYKELPAISTTADILRRQGLIAPQRIRTDNGVPFASNAIARLSTLSVWWIKLGIYPEQIEPGKPQQNGKHERMHRTLKKEATIPPEKDLRAQQRRFDVFRKDYNNDRPHEALDMKTPASLYASSPRTTPKKLEHFDYPSHFEVRRVSRNSGIRWRNEYVPVSSTLSEEYLGFEEAEDGIYNVYFCELLIGI